MGGAFSTPRLGGGSDAAVPSLPGQAQLGTQMPEPRRVHGPAIEHQLPQRGQARLGKAMIR
jgi:hypothetical protein